MARLMHGALQRWMMAGMCGLGLLVAGGQAAGQSRVVYPAITNGATANFDRNLDYNNGLTATVHLEQTDCSVVLPAVGPSQFLTTGVPDGPNYPDDWYTPTPGNGQPYMRLLVNRNGILPPAGCIVGTFEPTLILTATFNQTVVDPLFNFSNLEAGSYDFAATPAVSSITRLSGNTAFQLSGQLVNPGPQDEANPGCQTPLNAEGGCGTVKAIGRLATIVTNLSDADAAAATGDDHYTTIMLQQPGLIIRTTSIDGTGTFLFTTSNAVPTSNTTTAVDTVSLATTTAGTPVTTPTPPAFPASGSVQATPAAGTLYIINPANDVSVEETMPAGWVASGTCYDNASPGVVIATIGADGTVTLPSSSLYPSASYTCNFINTLVAADVSMTMTNTPLNGVSDQASDTVVSGSQTTYQIVVSNAGPAAADGAVLVDPAPTPTDRMTCTSVACTSAGGATCPSPLTVANLQSPGVAIPILPANGSVTVSLDCTID